MGLANNKVIVYIIGIIFAFISSLGIYYVWKRDIETRALLEYNQRQLEETVRIQQEYIKKQAELEEIQRSLSRRLAEENRTLQNRIRTIQNNLNSPQAAASDRPASDVLKRTVEQLGSSR